MNEENMDPSYSGEGIYKENILDHYKNPHNHGRLENADINSTQNNPLCGDIIHIDIKTDGQKVSDIKFSGKGCAISQAAASMLTDEIKNMSLDEIKRFNREDVIKLIGIEVGPVRTKCAVLGLVAIKEGIKNYGEGK